MKPFLFKILRYSFLVQIFRFLCQRNNVTILLFHDIDSKTAMQTFKYLSSNYNIIDLNDYIEAYSKNDFTKIPKYALILTFDDGHIRNNEILNAVEKYRAYITIFACASICGTNRHYWFNYGGEELKKVSNRERLKSLEKKGFLQTKEFNQPQALTAKHIEKMRTSKYINIQSHTLFHPSLPQCSDKDAEYEIVESKNILEKKYHLKVNVFAYPNGDYSNRDIDIIKKAGYKCAITVDYGFNNLKTDIFKLKRISVNDTDNIDELIVKSSGIWAFLKTRNGKRQAYGKSESIKDYK